MVVTTTSSINLTFLVKMDEFGHKGRAVHVLYLNSLHCPLEQAPIQACTLHWMHRQLHGLKIGARHHWYKFSVGSLCGWCLQQSPCVDKLRFLGLFSLRSWVWRKNHLWECHKKHRAKPFTALGRWRTTGINGKRKGYTWAQGKNFIALGQSSRDRGCPGKCNLH